MKIVKIIEIKDTRDYYIKEGEKYDKKIRIPGTGQSHECLLCGKLHEIHCFVEFENGNGNIGIGCARKTDVEFKKLERLYKAEQTLKELKEEKASKKFEIKIIEHYSDTKGDSVIYTQGIVMINNERKRFSFQPHVNLNEINDSIIEYAKGMMCPEIQRKINIAEKKLKDLEMRKKGV